jgi:LysR family transcriptional regulator, hydrogen peroxide-inducible genes activator
VCELTRSREFTDFRASSLNTLVRMVAAGTGITLIPATAVATEIRAREGTVAIPLVRRVSGRTIGLAWRGTSARKAEFGLLANCLRSSPPAGATVL